MNYTVVYLELAAQDVAVIRKYLSQFYLDTPVNFLTKLKRGIEGLRDNPFMYAEYADHPAYRRMVVMEYLVFYKVYDDSKTVEIHRVLHGMKNIKAHLP